MQYERGNRSTGIHRDVVCFNRLVGGVLSDGVPLRDLLEKRSLPDLVNGDGAGLPKDVAAKISIRIEVWDAYYLAFDADSPNMGIVPGLQEIH